MCEKSTDIAIIPVHNHRACIYQCGTRIAPGTTESAAACAVIAIHPADVVVFKRVRPGRFGCDTPPGCRFVPAAFRWCDYGAPSLKG